MAEPNNTDAPADTETPPTQNPAPVKTPGTVKWIAGVGIPVSLAAAAAVSFAGLTELGVFAGIDHPWLMPVAIDVYATTSTLVAMFLPEPHRARGTAVWHARLGIAMSMSGNALARALHLGTAGYTASDALLTFVGAWPSLIVERLLQLQGRLAAPAADAATETATQMPPVAPLAEHEQRHPVAVGGAADSATETAAAGATEKTATATRKRQRPIATVTEIGASGGGLSTPEWVERGAPVYLELTRRNGAAPSAPKLIAELVARGCPPVKDARARAIRGAIEEHLGLSKDAADGPEPDDETEEAS